MMIYNKIQKIQKYTQDKKIEQLSRFSIIAIEFHLRKIWATNVERV